MTANELYSLSAVGKDSFSGSASPDFNLIFIGIVQGFLSDRVRQIIINKYVRTTRVRCSTRLRRSSTASLLSSSSRASSPRPNDHQPFWRKQQQWRNQLPQLRPRDRQPATQESRLCRHLLVRLYAIYHGLLLDTPLHGRLQGHRARLRQMPDREVQD